MPLRCIENQANEPVTAVFLEWVAEGLGEFAEPMLHLIAHLEQYQIGMDMWVFTSHISLCFTPCDDYTVAIVRIAAIPQSGYRIVYAVPPHPLSLTQHPRVQEGLSMEHATAVIQAILQIWRDSGVTPRYEFTP